MWAILLRGLDSVLCDTLWPSYEMAERAADAWVKTSQESYPGPWKRHFYITKMKTHQEAAASITCWKDIK